MIQFNMMLTHAACEYIQSMMNKNQNKIFRLSIKKTGCSGFSYWPHLANQVDPQDTVFEVEDNLKIYVDTNWLSVLNGLSIDYVEENKIGLHQKRLVFSNPNENGRCGCGESFHLERDDDASRQND